MDGKKCHQSGGPRPYGKGHEKFSFFLEPILNVALANLSVVISAGKKLISTHTHQLSFCDDHASPRLFFLSTFLVPGWCPSKSQERSKQIDSSFLLVIVVYFLIARSFISFALGQLVVGGINNDHALSSVEVFPPSANKTCSIPDLPAPRHGHTLSLLSGGRFVVCGGHSPSILRSCIAWTRGSTSWKHLYTARSSNYILHTNKQLAHQHGKANAFGMESTISSRFHSSAWGLGMVGTVHSRDLARF